MPVNKYSKLLPLRILTIGLSIAMIIIIFLKGGAYDLVIRSEFSFFRCAPEDLIQNVLLKYMLLLSYFAVIILYALAQVFTLPIIKGHDNSAGSVIELGADLIASISGVLYLIFSKVIGKCVPLPGSIAYYFFIGVTAFFILNFIIKLILNKKITDMFEYKSQSAERNALLACCGVFFMTLCLFFIGLGYSRSASSDFGHYDSEFGDAVKAVEDTASNSFCGAVAVGDSIYYADTVSKPFDPSIYKIYKSGASKIVDGSHYLTNNGFLCNNGNNIYYLSKDFKNFSSKTFLVCLDTTNDTTHDIKFENVPAGYLVCDNFLAVRDNQLYFGLIFSSNTIEIWRIDTDKIGTTLDVNSAEKYAGNMVFVNNSDELYEALIHNSGMPDDSISYKNGKLFTLKTERSQSFSTLPDDMKEFLKTFKAHNYSDLYVSKSDSAYRKAYQKAVSNGSAIGNYTKDATLISENVDLFNIYKDNVYYSVITTNGCQIYRCQLDGSNKELLKQYDDHILCSRIYVSDDFVACYVSNREYYLLFDNSNASSAYENLEVIASK